MSGRVTRRKNHRRHNSEPNEWIVGVRSVIGGCHDVRHEKEEASIRAWAMLFGPFDDVRILDCGCEAAMFPLCQDCGLPIRVHQ